MMLEHESGKPRAKLIAEKLVEIRAARAAERASHSDPLIARLMFTTAKLRDLHEATRAVGNELDAVGLACTEQGNAQSPVERQDARLARLRELGGDRVFDERKKAWKTTGQGAFTKLVKELGEKGIKPCTEKSIRADLTASAIRAKENLRAGHWAGLTSK